MQYGSFYGGKPGIAPVIIAHYDSIADMTLKFSDGGNYNVVGYGLYVIIDTAINGKYSNPLNGIVYRRGMDYNERRKNTPTVPTPISGLTPLHFKDRYNEWLRDDFKPYALSPGAGAIYVGKIVGPEGKIAAFQISNYDDMTPPEDSGSISYLDDYASPGHDEIKYRYINVRNENTLLIEAYQIGFAIPKPKISISAAAADDYNLPLLLIERTDVDQDENPIGRFYSNWELTVPRGKHGTDVEDLAIYTSDTDNDQYLGVQYRDYLDSAAGTVKPLQGETGYDNGYYKLAPYRVIDSISDNHVESGQRPLETLDPSKNIKVGVKYNGPTGFPNNLCLLCIKGGAGTGGSASVFENKGEGFLASYGEAKLRVVQKTDIPPSKIIVDYTQGGNDLIGIRLLDDILLDDNGLLYAIYTNPDPNKPVVRLRLGTVQDIIKVDFIKEVDTYNNQGQVVTPNYPISKIRIKYNTYKKDGSGNIIIDDKFIQASSGGPVNLPTTDDEGRMVEWLKTPIKFIDEISWNNANGDVTVTYSDGTTQPLINSLKGLTKALIDNNNYIKLTYNTGLTTTLIDAKLDTIKKISIKNEGDLSKEQRFLATYTLGKNNTRSEDISQNNLNYIVDAKLNGDNLCILWSSPSYRDNLTNYYELSYNGSQLKYKYQNLGPILDGEHIIGDFDSLADLQAQYPDGFGKKEDGSDVNRAGWVATVSESDGAGGTTTKLYAYDYIGTKGWYMIYSLADSAVKPQTVVLVDYADSTDPTRPRGGDGLLQDNGLWFVVEEAPTYEQLANLAPYQSITNLFS